MIRFVPAGELHGDDIRELQAQLGLLGDAGTVLQRVMGAQK